MSSPTPHQPSAIALFQPERFLILVVDDIPSNIRLMTELLEDVGYATTFVTSGREALERVNQAKPDLILLDLDGKPNGMKPITGMNGILSGLLYFLNGRLL